MDDLTQGTLDTAASNTAASGPTPEDFEQIYQEDLNIRCAASIAASRIAQDAQRAIDAQDLDKAFHGLSILRSYADRTTDYFVSLGAVPNIVMTDPDEFSTPAHKVLLEKLKAAQESAREAASAGGSETTAFWHLLGAIVWQMESSIEAESDKPDLVKEWLLEQSAVILN